MSKHIVRFTVWSMHDPAKSQNNLQISKSVEADTPLRDVAIEILKTQNSIPISATGTENTIDYDQLPLIIKPMPKNADDNNFRDEDEFLFGPRYLIQPNGSIRMLRGMEPMRAWSLSELDELSDHGYIDYKKDNVIVVVPQGLGGTADFTSMIEMISTIGTIINISRAAISAPGFIKSVIHHFLDIRVRALAKQWIKQGIRYPFELREFIDLKAGWSLKEVRTRLRINEEYAVKLLTALGFEPVGNLWKLTQSKKSTDARKRWIANERYWNKKRRQDG